MSYRLDKLNETLALAKAGTREHTAAVVARARYDLKLRKKTPVWISEQGPGMPVLLNGDLPYRYLFGEPKTNVRGRPVDSNDVLVYLPNTWGEGVLFESIRKKKRKK